MEYLSIILIGWLVNALSLLIFGITLMSIMSKQENLNELAGASILQKIMIEKEHVRNELVNQGKNPFTQRDFIIFLPFAMFAKIMTLVFLSKYNIITTLIVEQEQDLEILKERLETENINK
jgi:hypothetical protein